MALHNELGAWGEKVAREYLLCHGYAIGGENTRIGNYEIDFIAEKDGMIVFVEVKTRSTHFADPLEAVDSRKQARLVRAADEYIRAMNIKLEPRFDIITVIGSPEHFEIEHFPDAFFPPLTNR